MRRARKVTKPETDTPTPRRTCVGCRRRATPADLYRCALTADGDVVVSRTAPGRGAWLCGEQCLAAAIRQRRFARAWRRPVPDDIDTRLRAALEAARVERRADASDEGRGGRIGTDVSGSGAVEVGR